MRSEGNSTLLKLPAKITLPSRSRLCSAGTGVPANRYSLS